MDAAADSEYPQDTIALSLEGLRRGGGGEHSGEDHVVSLWGRAYVQRDGVFKRGETRVWTGESVFRFFGLRKTEFCRVGEVLSAGRDRSMRERDAGEARVA